MCSLSCSQGVTYSLYHLRVLSYKKFIPFYSTRSSQPITYFDPYDLDSMPCSVSCRELMRILQRSSLAILLCLMSEMAVTRVSIALAYSPAKKIKTFKYIYKQVTAFKHGHSQEQIAELDIPRIISVAKLTENLI